MIVYSSKGDEDVATRDLRTSKAFTERCTNFLEHINGPRRFFTYQLLIEIWTIGFLSSMLVLDWNWIETEATNPHRLLGGALNRIDQLELMQAPPVERLIWINDTIERFK